MNAKIGFVVTALGRVHFRCDIFLTANFHPFLLIAVKCLFFNRFFCPLDML